MRNVRVLSLIVAVTVGPLLGCGGKPTSPSTLVTTLSVSITGAASLMQKGQSVQLKAIANLSDGSQADVTATAVWRSHNSNVATVSASGMVTAVAPGTCDIEADSQGVKGQTQVSVRSVEMTGITLAGNPTFTSAGQSAQMTATARFSDGSEQDVTASATWSSSQPLVATVSSDGLVTARAPGESDITAAVGPHQAVIRARVGGVEVPKIVRLVVTGPSSLTLGQTLRFKAIAHMSDGSEVDVSASAAWSTTNSLVSVAADGGLVTALGLGSCDVLAVHAGLTARATVQVTLTDESR